MRASRLLSLLLLLQNRGRMSAARLAAELGVSPRTVYRDVEALASAGVPVTVPSTKGRTGVHPLELILTRRLRLPDIPAAPNPRYPADDRSFHPYRFTVPPINPDARVLILDDTWTTGARLQSLAHALKTAGASAVIGVVLGRFIRPTYEPARSLIERLRRAPVFDLDHCALDVE